MDYKIKMEQVRSGKLNIVTEPGQVSVCCERNVYFTSNGWDLDVIFIIHGSLLQAELSVSALIPDRSKDFDFLPRSMKSFNDWIVDAYYSSRPPK